MKGCTISLFTRSPLHPSSDTEWSSPSLTVMDAHDFLNHSVDGSLLSISGSLCVLLYSFILFCSRAIGPPVAMSHGLKQRNRVLQGRLDPRLQGHCWTARYWWRSAGVSETNKRVREGYGSRSGWPKRRVALWFICPLYRGEAKRQKDEEERMTVYSA